MKRKPSFLLIAFILALPVTLFAGSEGDKGFNISETAIEAPVATVFDKNGPPKNPMGDGYKHPMGPYQLFDHFYYIGTESVGSFVIDTGAGLILIDAGWGDKRLRYNYGRSGKD